MRSIACLKLEEAPSPADAGSTELLPFDLNPKNFGNRNISHDIELFNSLTAKAGEQIRNARADVDVAEKHYSELLESAEKLRKEYDRLLTWADPVKGGADENLDQKVRR